METLYQQLVEYNHSDYYPFHMPGHKRQKCFENMTEMSQMHQLDITEIEGFDNLHQPEGVLLAAQQRAARLYHAEESFFLVNGSTCGILAALSTVAKNKSKVLIARNCHKAVYHGVLLNRLVAEYVWPDYMEQYDIQGPVSTEEIEKCLRRNNNIAGIVLTSPTYDGITSDIRSICKLAHDYHVPVIVDEAHGAHFVFHQSFPESALLQGADIVINSTHKTLPALTQTAILHVQGNLINRQCLKDYLAIYQTSSPSYLLMASIDAAMEWAEANTPAGFEPLLSLRKLLEEKCCCLQHIRLMPWVKGQTDPGKIVISVKGTSVSGAELYQMLYQRYKLQMEMAAPTYVLGILTSMDKEKGIIRLAQALYQIDQELEKQECHGTPQSVKEVMNRKNFGKGAFLYHQSACPHSRMSLWEASQTDKQWEYIGKSVGKICGEMISIYPPGIPILLPGEQIEEIHVEQIQRARQMAMKVQGFTPDEKICIICV